MKNVSMRSIAAVAGVSVNTVSLALRGDQRLPEHTRERVCAVSKKMGYCRNPLVAALMAARGKRKDAEHSELVFGYMTIGKTPDEWMHYNAPRRYFEGAKHRAETQGYRLEPFWLSDPNVPAKRMDLVLSTRRVQGLLFAPVPEAETYANIDCAPYACVALGSCAALRVALRIQPDQLHAVNYCLRELKNRGYRRIGLVVRRYVDERENLEWTAMFRSYHAYLRLGRGIPPLILENRVMDSEDNRTAFRNWMVARNPDALLFLNPVVLRWIAELGLRAPENIGLACLELWDDIPEISGINRECEAIGAAAVDELVAKLGRNERGLPDRGRVLLLQGSWIEGKTLRPAPSFPPSADTSPH